MMDRRALAPPRPVASEAYRKVVKQLPDADQRTVMDRELDWQGVYDQFMLILTP
jgi:hypothetical protein